jgi:hypothetical protein
MDLELKPEFQGSTVREKCFPMPKPDVLEMERQVEELVSSGLVEEFKWSDFPRFCSRSFLVEKDKGKETKIAKTKRLVGD